MPKSLPDPQALRNLKSTNPILRNCMWKESGLKHFCLIFRISLRIKQNCINLGSLKLQFFRIGLMYFRFLNACWSRRHFWVLSEANLVSQFIHKRSLCHKTSQNSTVLTVSCSSDCRCRCALWSLKNKYLFLSDEIAYQRAVAVKDEEKEFKNLPLNSFYLSFMILGSGCGISIVVFVV